MRFIEADYKENLFNNSAFVSLKMKGLKVARGDRCTLDGLCRNALLLLAFHEYYICGPGPSGR